MDRPSLHPSGFSDHDGLDDEPSNPAGRGVARRLIAAVPAVATLSRRRLFVWRRSADVPMPVSAWWVVLLRILVVGCGAYAALLAILAYRVLRISPTEEAPPLISEDIGARTVAPGVWLYGQLTARRVLSGGSDPLRHAAPLAIIVPDAHEAAYELRDLISAVHKTGYLVAVVNPLAAGVGDGFTRIGIGEAGTVRQVREQLLKRPDVDRSRVVLIGRGTGAVACLMASQGRGDPGKGLVLIDMPAGPEQWMQSQLPAYCKGLPGLIAAKWMGEMSLGFDADEAEGLMPSRCVAAGKLLQLDSVECGPAGRVAEKVATFLRRSSAPVADAR